MGKIFNGYRAGGIRYADVFTKDDTIGCGIKMKTGEMFFTVNGKSLGESCILAYPKSLIILPRGGLHKCEGNAVSHDWSHGARV